MTTTDIELKLIVPEYQDFIPQYETPGSAGMDLKAFLPDFEKAGTYVVVGPGASVLIQTNIAVKMNRDDIAGFIMPRSGLGHRDGIVLGNLTGVIDSDDTGEILISVWNRKTFGAIHIHHGDRIAQLVFKPIYRVNGFKVVTDFSEETERGDGGFGSTDRN